MKNVVNFSNINKRYLSLNSKNSPNSQYLYDIANTSFKENKVSKAKDASLFFEKSIDHDNANNHYRRCLSLIERATKEDTRLSSQLESIFKTNILPCIEDLNSFKESLSRFSLNESFVKESLDLVKKYKICDRVLKNNENLSKRFDFNKYIVENSRKPLDEVVSVFCSMIDTYNIPPYAKMNIIFEETSYLLQRNGIKYDSKELVKNVTDYFLFRENKISEDDYKAYKSVLRENMMISESDIESVNYFNNRDYGSSNYFYLNEDEVVNKNHNFGDAIRNSNTSIFSTSNSIASSYESIGLGNISLVGKDVEDTIVKDHLQLFDKKIAEALLESKNIVEEYKLYLNGRFSEDLEKAKENTIYKNLKAVATQIDYGIDEENKVFKNLILNLTEIPEDPEAVRTLLKCRLEYNKKMTNIFSKMIKNNYKLLDLEAKKANAIAKALTGEDSGKQRKAIAYVKKLFEKNKSKFKKPWGYDFTEVGFGKVFITKDEIGLMEEYYTIESLLQKAAIYDCIIFAHGGTLSKDMSKKDEKDFWKNQSRAQRIQKKVVKGEKINFKDQIDSGLATAYNAKYAKKYGDKETDTWTMQPVATDKSGTFTHMNDFVEECIKEGYKKIFILSCNPGSHKLDKKLTNMKGVTIRYSTASNLGEEAIETLSCDDESILECEAELESYEENLISMAEDYNIDYDDDSLLYECYEFVSEAVLNEMSAKEIWNNIVEFAGKVVGAVIYFGKMIIKLFGDFIKWIKNLFGGKKITNKTDIKGGATTPSGTKEFSDLTVDQMKEETLKAVKECTQEFNKFNNKQKQDNEKIKAKVASEASKAPNVDKKNEAFVLEYLTSTADEVMPLIDKFKAEEDKDVNKLKIMINNVFTKSPESIIEGVPSLFGIIRSCIIFSTFAIPTVGPVIALVSYITSQFISLDLDRKQVSKLITRFENEIEKVENKLDDEDDDDKYDDLKHYLDALNDGLFKLEQYKDTLYSDTNIDDIIGESANSEVLSLNEFKIFKFHNLIRAAMEIDKFIKRKGNKAVGKIVDTSKKIFNPVKVKKWFNESYNGKDDIYEFITENNNVDICVAIFNVEESYDMHTEFSNLCKYINESILPSNSTMRSYYLTKGDSYELRLKDTNYINLTEAEEEMSKSVFMEEDLYYLSNFINLSESVDIIKECNIESLVQDIREAELYPDEFITVMECANYTNGLIDKDTASSLIENYFDTYGNEDYVLYTNLSNIRKNWLNEETDIQNLASALYDIRSITEKVNNTSSKVVNKKPMTSGKSIATKSSNNSIIDNYNKAMTTAKLAFRNAEANLKNLSAKEQEASKMLDATIGHFYNAAKQFVSNDNRESIIKGSVIPSFSKCIKYAIVLAGTGFIAQSVVVPVVLALGAIGISKKNNAKERALILDEIDIELKICEKEIQMAESDNNTKRMRELMQLQKKLKREYSRIKYNIKVGQDMPNSGGESD